jgi:EpsI family protein
MSSIFVRMGIVIGALVAVQLGFQYVFHLQNPIVVDPLSPLDAFPKVVRNETTGEWTGIDQKLEKEEFNYAQLDSDVSRLYTNRDNRTMSLLLGIYKIPANGLYHNPFNCYETHGFVLKQKERRPLTAPHRPDTELSLSTWDKDGQKHVVAYWYELGDNTLFERDDLAPWKPTLWAMAGKRKWPVMFKVLIEAAGSDTDQAKADVLEMATTVREWLGTVQPKLD